MEEKFGTLYERYCRGCQKLERSPISREEFIAFWTVYETDLPPGERTPDAIRKSLRDSIRLNRLAIHRQKQKQKEDTLRSQILEALAVTGSEDEDRGMGGAGSREPRRPRTPVRSGSAAVAIPEEEFCLEDALRERTYHYAYETVEMAAL